MEGEIDLDDQISARGKRRNNKTLVSRTLDFRIEIFLN